MRIIRCDRCGKDIEPGSQIFYVSVQNRKWSDGELCGENPYEDWDICEGCAKAIVWMIDGAEDAGQDPEHEEAEEPAEEPEDAPQEPEEPKKRKHVDLKVLRELVKADKTAKEIADYFGITLKQYYYQRKRAEQLYIEGRL